VREVQGDGVLVAAGRRAGSRAGVAAMRSG